MTSWLLIRTDHAKESYCARQIELAGFPAWVPAELRHVRKHPKSKALVMREFPILPHRVLACVPEPAIGQVRRIRHIAAIECNSALAPLQIPANDIARFRAEIDRINTEILALARMATTRKERKRWKSLQEGLQDMIQQARQDMEMAA